MGEDRYFDYCQSIRLELLDLYGKCYIAEHIASSLRREQKELQLFCYVTDALKIMTENTSRYIVPGVGDVEYGSHLRSRWIELQTSKKNYQPEKEKSGDEIAADLIRRAGLKLRDGEKQNG